MSRRPGGSATTESSSSRQRKRVGSDHPDNDSYPKRPSTSHHDSNSGGGGGGGGASNGGAYNGPFSPDSNFFVTKDTFVLDNFPVHLPAQTLFFFFERGDVTGKTEYSDLRFGYMKKEYKTILRLLLFSAHALQAPVRLIYLEPEIEDIGDRQRLPLSLRCALTSSFCLAVTFEKNPKYRNTCVNGADRAFGYHAFTDDLEAQAMHYFNHEDPENAMQGIEDVVASVAVEDGEDYFKHMILNSQLLACVDLNIISSTTAHIVCSDKNTVEEIVSLYDWTAWKYTPRALHARINGVRFSLDKPFNVGPTSITPRSIVASMYAYFENNISRRQRDDEDDEEDLDVDSTHDMGVIFNSLFRRLSVPDASPVYKEYKRKFPDTPSVAIVESLTAPADHSFAVCVSDALVFQYSLFQLVSKDDLNLFERVPLINYPHGIDAPNVKELVAKITRAKDNGTERMFCVEKVLTEGENSEDNQFDLVWPHLNAYRKALGVVSATTTAENTKLFSLRVKYKLFINIIVRNAEKITLQPVAAILNEVNASLGADELSPKPLLANNTKLRYVLDAETHTAVPRRNDYTLLRTVFLDTFGLGRNCQAYLTLLHLFHTTAPKWKANKIMLVNHTRGGTGKTHTVNCLCKLFDGVPGLFRFISTMTDAVLKYAEINVGKMVVLDDVGLSHQQQKNSKKEDSLIPAQFKSLLDTGYTVNDSTERDAKTKNFKATTKTTVLNNAFVWNTNTVETFSPALLDRCVILQTETVVGPFDQRTEQSVKETLAHFDLKQRFRRMFVRHNLVQTLLYTACPEIAMPEKDCMRFLNSLIDGLRELFPIPGAANSFLRGSFQLFDLAMAEALRTAVNVVFELWVPPWTLAPKTRSAHDTVRYMQKFDKARSQALDMVETHEMLVEVAAQLKLFFPSAAMQIVCLQFYRTVDSLFDCLSKIVLAAMKHNSRDAVYILNNAAQHVNNSMQQQQQQNSQQRGDDYVESYRSVVVLNQLNTICFDVFNLEAIVIRSGLGVRFKHPNGDTLRPLEEIGQSHVKMNIFFFLELLKRYWRRETFVATRNRLLHVFRQQLTDLRHQAEQGITHSKLTLLNYVPADNLEKTFLKILAAHKETYGTVITKLYGNRGGYGGDDVCEFSVSPALWGIADQLVKENPGEEHMVPKKYRKHIELEVEPRMTWFTETYISEVLLHLFEHAPSVLLPSGNELRYIAKSAEPSPLLEKHRHCFGDLPPLGWEYEQAENVYEKYGCRVDDVRSETASYIGLDPRKPQRLTEGLPQNIEEAMNRVAYRYAKPVADIQELIDKTRQRTNTSRTRHRHTAQNDEGVSSPVSSTVVSEASSDQRWKSHVSDNVIKLWERINRLH